jgi:hypothetical protein
MNRDTVRHLQSFFNEYVSGFYSQGEDQEYDWAIRLKEDHSQRVRENIISISRQLLLPEQDILLAGVLGLFHDIGRFSQYRTYRTFRDDLSENHAELGLKELAGAHVLNNVVREERRIIEKGILYHNLYELPEGEDPRCLFFSKLLRDADKLDIWRVIISYYHNENDNHSRPALELGLPDTPGYSKTILNDLCATKSSLSSAVKNLNDFKLLQIGWLYDINFHPTFQEINKRNYIEGIVSALPETEDIKKVAETAEQYLAMNVHLTDET